MKTVSEQLQNASSKSGSKGTKVKTAPKTTGVVNATVKSSTITPSFGFEQLADMFSGWVAEWKTRTNRETGNEYNVLVVKFNWKEETTDNRPGLNVFRGDDGNLYIGKTAYKFEVNGETKEGKKEKLVDFYRKGAKAVSDQAVAYTNALIAQGILS